MIEVGFVNRFYALARFFVTFLGVFTAFAAPRALELAVAFRSGFLARLEAGFPTFRAALAPLPAALAPLGVDLDAFRDPGRAVRLAAPGFLDALAAPAPIAARMRVIFPLTCSMGIMTSTLSSLRRAE